jgi:hypothetical protein
VVQVPPVDEVKTGLVVLVVPQLSFAGAAAKADMEKVMKRRVMIKGCIRALVLMNRI